MSETLNCVAYDPSLGWMVRLRAFFEANPRASPEDAVRELGASLNAAVMTRRWLVREGAVPRLAHAQRYGR